jgi:hypothetical protein
LYILLLLTRNKIKQRLLNWGARGSLVVKAQARGVAGSKPDEVTDFFMYLILPATLGPGVYSASDRNEYQKQKNNISGE